MVEAKNLLEDYRTFAEKGDQIGVVVEKYWRALRQNGCEGLAAGIALARAKARFGQETDQREKELWQKAVEQLEVEARVGFVKGADFENGFKEAERLLVDVAKVTKQLRPTNDQAVLGSVCQEKMIELER